MRFFILLASVALVACGSDHRKDRENNSGTSSGSATPTIALDKPSSPAAASPSSAPVSIAMPNFAPQYPGSTISAVSPSPGSDGAHEVTLRTQDDAAKIADFYREKFAAAGLKKASEFLSGGTGMISAAGNGRRASIAIAKEDDHNAVIVTFSGS